MPSRFNLLLSSAPKVTPNWFLLYSGRGSPTGSKKLRASKLSLRRNS